MKFLFLFLCLFCFYAFADVGQSIEEIVEIVNNGKIKLEEKREKIAKLVMDVYDYSSFFKIIAGVDVWNGFSENDKQDLSRKYNKYFVDQYMNEIASCKHVVIKLSNVEKSIMTGYYICDDQDRKTLKFILNNDGKIVDAQVNNLSFLKIQQDKIGKVLTGSANLEERQSALKKVIA